MKVSLDNVEFIFLTSSSAPSRLAMYMILLWGFPTARSVLSEDFLLGSVRVDINDGLIFPIS